MEKISSLLRPRKSHVELARKVDYRGHHLTLAQRMQIISRRDRMGRTKPGWMRVLCAALTVLLVLIIGNALHTRALNRSVAKAEPRGENEIRLSFAGDLMLGRYVQTYGEKESYAELFAPIEPLFKASDFVFANLECAVLSGEPDEAQAADKLVLSAREDALRAAVDAGINVFALANNHAADYGRSALQKTTEMIDALGVTYAGAGENWEEAPKYRVLEKDGFKIGFLSCTDTIPKGFSANKDGFGVATSKNYRVFQNLNRAARECDLTVVYVHWGKEDITAVTDRQRELAHRLISSGADVVIGSHPHVLQEVEQYQTRNRSGIIFYSLGNFVFDQGQRPSRNTVLAQLDVDRTTGAGSFTLIPMHLENFHPFVTDNSLYCGQIRNIMTDALPKSAYSVMGDGRIEIPVQFDLTK